MAARTQRRQTKAAPKGAADVSDLDILHPDGEVTIGDRGTRGKG